MIGEMGLVVEHSLQYLTPADLAAMVAYLRRVGHDGPAPDPIEAPDEMALLTAAEQLRPSETAAMLTAADPGMALGPRVFLDNCGACHFVDGRGANEVSPNSMGIFW